MRTLMSVLSYADSDVRPQGYQGYQDGPFFQLLTAPPHVLTTSPFGCLTSQNWEYSFILLISYKGAKNIKIDVFIFRKNFLSSIFVLILKFPQKAQKIQKLCVILLLERTLF